MMVSVKVNFLHIIEKVDRLLVIYRPIIVKLMKKAEVVLKSNVELNISV